MNYKKLEQVLSTLKDEDGFSYVVNNYKYPDLLTRERQEAILEQQAAARKYLIWQECKTTGKQAKDFYTMIGVEEAEYESKMYWLTKNLLEPMCFLREVLDCERKEKSLENITDEEKEEVVAQFIQATFILYDQLDGFADILGKNFRTLFPATIYSLIYQLQQDFKTIAGCCTSYDYHVRETPFYAILRDWLTVTKKEYSPRKLELQFELIKQGPHILTTEAREKLTFKDLFAFPEDYEKVMDILIKGSKVDKRSGYWLDDNGGWKKSLVSLLKTLKDKGYFRRDEDIVPELYRIVAKNTFNVNVSESLIEKMTQKERLPIDYIPDRC